MDVDSAADDDPWLDEDIEDPAVIAQNSAREWQKLSTTFTDSGYREGVNAGRGATIQAGFDEGYGVTGAPIGHEVGLLRGASAALLAYLTSSSTAVQLPSGADKASAVEEAREVVRRLGRIKLVDVAGKDEEAERFARKYGEEIVVPREVQEKREMEALEEDMEGLVGRVNGRSGSEMQKTAGKDELESCRHALEQLLLRVGLGKVQL